MIDHFANILPTLSKRFSVHRSLIGCDLPDDHECWNIWPKKHNSLPKTFATHSELYDFKQEGSELRVMQDKYEKALRGPVKKTVKRADGQEYELEGMPSHPTFRRLAGAFDVTGNWIPRVPESETDTLYVEIMHYKVTETVSLMLGGYDEHVKLKDENRRPYQVKFGPPAGMKAYQLQDHIGTNAMPVNEAMKNH
eukprot:1790766-Amphidinium_carterae.5